MMRISALILASGKSRRFGGNKLELKVKGKSLLERVVSAAARSFVDDVVCVTTSASGHSTIDGKMIVYIPPEGELLSDSLKTGVKAVRNFSDAVVILLGDMICVEPYLINTIISVYHAHPDNPVASKRDTLLMPPVLVPRKHFSPLLKLKGNAGARYLLRRMNGIRTVNISNAEALDVDVRKDLELIRECEEI